VVPLTKAFIGLQTWQQAAERADLPAPAGSRQTPYLKAILCVVSIVGISAGATDSQAAARERGSRLAAPPASDTIRSQSGILAGTAELAGTIQLAQADFPWNARRAYRQRDYKTALKLWTWLAEKKSNPEAQHMLGVMHENGEGVPLDLVKAAEWYRLAAKQGYSDAQLSLGVLYENGEGVAKDLHKAAEWYHKAAKKGELLAQFSLGIMYRQGRGVPRDDKQAAHWLTKVAQRGYAVGRRQGRDVVSQSGGKGAPGRTEQSRPHVPRRPGGEAELCRVGALA
jgi:TPR repeat protein